MVRVEDDIQAVKHSMKFIYIIIALFTYLFTTHLFVEVGVVQTLEFQFNHFFLFVGDLFGLCLLFDEGSFGVDDLPVVRSAHIVHIVDVLQLTLIYLVLLYIRTLLDRLSFGWDL